MPGRYPGCPGGLPQHRQDAGDGLRLIDQGAPAEVFGHKQIHQVYDQSLMCPPHKFIRGI